MSSPCSLGVCRESYTNNSTRTEMRQKHLPGKYCIESPYNKEIVQHLLKNCIIVESVVVIAQFNKSQIFFFFDNGDRPRWAILRVLTSLVVANIVTPVNRFSLVCCFVYGVTADTLLKVSDTIPNAEYFRSYDGKYLSFKILNVNTARMLQMSNIGYIINLYVIKLALSHRIPGLYILEYFPPIVGHRYARYKGITDFLVSIKYQTKTLVGFGLTARISIER